MAEHPILFSGPMVCAILAGRKTQTRRALKPKWPLADVIPAKGDDRGRAWFGAKQVPLKEPGDMYPFRCRYGVPGDALWVRETFSPWPECSLTRPPPTLYRADYQGDASTILWKPSIFMPRKESRITLRIENVRVERLQAISRKDEIAEGTPKGEFFDSLWDRINGKTLPWSSNPWVWVVQFARL